MLFCDNESAFTFLTHPSIQLFLCVLAREFEGCKKDVFQGGRIRKKNVPPWPCGLFRTHQEMEKLLCSGGDGGSTTIAVVSCMLLQAPEDLVVS